MIGVRLADPYLPLRYLDRAEVALLLWNGYPRALVEIGASARLAGRTAPEAAIPARIGRVPDRLGPGGSARLTAVVRPELWLSAGVYAMDLELRYRLAGDPAWAEARHERLAALGALPLSPRPVSGRVAVLTVGPRAVAARSELLAMLGRAGLMVDPEAKVEVAVLDAAGPHVVPGTVRVAVRRRDLPPDPQAAVDLAADLTAPRRALAQAVEAAVRRVAMPSRRRLEEGPPRNRRAPHGPRPRPDRA